MAQPGTSNEKGVFVLYGPPGGGKSKEAQETFQGSLTLATAANNLKFYKQYLSTPEGAGLLLPKREIVLDVYATVDSAGPFGPDGRPTPQMQLDGQGMPVPLPFKSRFEGMITQVVRKSLGERAQGVPSTYQNLIIDEAGVAWVRVFEEIVQSTMTAAGKANTLKAFGDLSKWSRQIMDYLRQVLMAGMNVVLVAHDGMPDAATGKKGGPKFPSQGVMSQLCADADAVIFRDIEDAGTQVQLNDATTATVGDPRQGPVRTWRVHGSQNWLSKIRGIPDAMFEEVRAMALTDIVKAAGFEP